MPIKTEVFGLDTPSLAGSLELLGINSTGWRVLKPRVKDSPVVLEKDIYFHGKKPWSWERVKSWWTGRSPEPTQVTALRDNNIRFWSRDVVYYLAAFNPLLIELNEANKESDATPETQKYRKDVSDFFKVRYQQMNDDQSYDTKFATPFEEGAGVLLEGFALGGAQSSANDVTKSIAIFVERNPGQKSFARLLEANESYWQAVRKESDAPQILSRAFIDLGFGSSDAGMEVNMGTNACVGLNLLEGIAEGTDLVCISEYRTSFDIAMIHMFEELDDRQDVLLKWLVGHMFALYQKTALCPQGMVKSSEGVCAPAIVKPIYKEVAKAKVIKRKVVEKPKTVAKPAKVEELAKELKAPPAALPPPPPPFKEPEQQWVRTHAFD